MLRQLPHLLCACSLGAPKQVPQWRLRGRVTHAGTSLLVGVAQFRRRLRNALELLLFSHERLLLPLDNPLLALPPERRADCQLLLAQSRRHLTPLVLHPLPGGRIAHFAAAHERAKLAGADVAGLVCVEVQPHRLDRRQVHLILRHAQPN